MIWSVLLSLIHISKIPYYLINLLQFVTFIIAFPALFVRLIFTCIRSSKEKLLLSLLSQNYDCRVIGPISERLWHSYRFNSLDWLKKTYELEQIEIAALHKVKSEEDINLNAFQIECLCNALNQNSTELRIAILQAMPYMGNKHSLEAVRRLAAKKITNENGNVIKAAIDCLPALEERVFRLNVNETLLRPSIITQKENEELLRPNVKPADSSSVELLRPSLDDM